LPAGTFIFARDGVIANDIEMGNAPLSQRAQRV
jgi:hypothetical protein